MEQGLRGIPSWRLDKFIEDYLLLYTGFGADVRLAIKVLCDFLKERCIQGAAHPVRVSKVVKCKEKLGKPLPPQYALELLTVYAWERGNGFTEFDTAQDFRTVLELVTKYKQLQIYWTDYYDFQHQEVSNYLHRQLRKARPVILDPADPTGNVAGGNPEGWRRLAEETEEWLWYSCFMRKDGSLVSSWDVPVDENWTCILL